MKDAYSFDATDDGAIVSYNKMKAAYTAFFTRCGLKTIAVEADLFQEALPAGRLHRRGSTTALSISRRRIFNR
jgi:hypothetical protein